MDGMAFCPKCPCPGGRPVEYRCSGELVFHECRHGIQYFTEALCGLLDNKTVRKGLEEGDEVGLMKALEGKLKGKTWCVYGQRVVDRRPGGCFDLIELVEK